MPLSVSERKTAEMPTLDRALDHSREFHEYWKKQSEDLRKAQEAVGENINVEARVVGPQETLHDYLREGLNNSDALVLRALSSLQLHGFWETHLPKGYTIEVQAGKLSLFKQAEDGSREYYRAPTTGKWVHDLPLLAAIPQQEVLYFKSGGYRETLTFKKAKNKAEARKMVEDAIQEGRFARLTGMVNGVKISDKVRLGMRHKVAAQEMLFLLEKTPSVFDAQTMNWINRSGNLEDLKTLAEGKWSKMNRLETEDFKRVRSSEGAIQLTLAWRRLRTVLPNHLLTEIRKSNLDPNQISSLQMTLTQTEATTGKELAEDRRVVVETVVLPKTFSDSESKVEQAKPPSPTPEVQVPPQKVETEKLAEETNESENEEQAQEVKVDQTLEDTVQTDKEATETPKSPEEIAEKIWEEDDLITLKSVIEPYQAEINMIISDVDAFNKKLKLSYASDLKEGGVPISVEQVVEVKLATEMGNYATYKIDDKEFTDPGDMVEYMAKAVQARIEAATLEEFESLIETHILRALPAENIRQDIDRGKEKRKERQEMQAEGKSRAEIRGHFKDQKKRLKQHRKEFKEGNFDSVMDEIRKHYGPGSLKLDTLVGKQRYTDTTFFSAGGLGSPPLLISVERQKDQVGLVFSGAKIKKPIFYSLESNDKYEVESISN